MYHTIKAGKLLPMPYPLGNYTHSPGQHFGMIYCTCQVLRVELHNKVPRPYIRVPCTTLKKAGKLLPMSYPLGNYTHSPGQHIGMIYCTCQVLRVELHKFTSSQGTQTLHQSPMYHTIKAGKLLPMSYPLGNYTHSPGQHIGMIYCTCQVLRVELHKFTRYPDLTSESHVPHYKSWQASPNVIPSW